MLSLNALGVKEHLHPRKIKSKIFSEEKQSVRFTIYNFFSCYTKNQAKKAYNLWVFFFIFKNMLINLCISYQLLDHISAYCNILKIELTRYKTHIYCIKLTLGLRSLTRLIIKSAQAH
jgi:hypothetical protein